MDGVDGLGGWIGWMDWVDGLGEWMSEQSCSTFQTEFSLSEDV